jgi:hypothetical protein
MGSKKAIGRSKEKYTCRTRRNRENDKSSVEERRKEEMKEEDETRAACGLRKVFASVTETSKVAATNAGDLLGGGSSRQGQVRDCSRCLAGGHTARDDRSEAAVTLNRLSLHHHLSAIQYRKFNCQHQQQQ